MLLPRADRPVDPFTIEVLRLIDRILKANTVPYFLVGATARDLLLWNVFGLPVERATDDIDLALAVASWQAFDKIKQQLLAGQAFVADPRRAHRLYYLPTEKSRGYPVDLVPFGSIESASGQIEWPPDQTVRMTVLGFRESLAATTAIRLADDLQIPVPTLACMAALKVFAWRDRQDTTKDALDLALLLRKYASAGNETRLFESRIDMMKAAQFDLQLAGARLLGADVRAVLTPRTTSALLATLHDARLRAKLVLDMAAACRTAADPVELAASLLEQFVDGFGAG